MAKVIPNFNKLLRQLATRVCTNDVAKMQLITVGSIPTDGLHYITRSESPINEETADSLFRGSISTYSFRTFSYFFTLVVITSQNQYYLTVYRFYGIILYPFLYIHMYLLFNFYLHICFLIFTYIKIRWQAYIQIILSFFFHFIPQNKLFALTLGTYVI